MSDAGVAPHHAGAYDVHATFGGDLMSGGLLEDLSLRGRLHVERPPLEMVVFELRFPLILALLKNTPPER